MTGFVDDNGNYLDYSGEDFTITKQSISVNNFQLKGDVSVNFKLANNATNRSVLGYFGLNQVNGPAFSKTPFSLIRNGNKFSKGFIVIQRNNGPQLECYYISGNSNWFSDFDFNIQDLDLTDFYVGDWTMTTVGNSIGNSSGIVYPLVDWMYKRNKASRIYAGDVRSKNDSIAGYDSIIDFYPCFYMKSLWEYIFRRGGYKYAGNLFSDPLFQSIIITPDSGDLQFSDNYVSSKSADTVLLNNQVVTGATTTKVLLTSKFPNPVFDDVNNQWTLIGIYGVEFIFNLVTNVNQTYTISLYQGATLITTFPLTGSILTFTQALTGFTGTATLNISGPSGFTISKGSTMRFGLKKNIRFANPIYPNLILPDMKGIDVIKAIANRFGCVVSYDEISKTVNFNKIETLNSTEDWSDFFKSNIAIYEQGFQNNYLRVNQPDEVSDYNTANDVGFGETNLKTPFSVNLNKDLYTDPFPGTVDKITNNNLGLLQSFIPLVNLSDSDSTGTAYTSVTNVSGFAVLNGTFPDPPILFSIIRVQDTSGRYTGYHMVTQVSSTQITLNSYPNLNATGVFYKQTYSFASPKSRLLINIPSYSVSNVGVTTSIDTYQSPTVTNRTSYPFAYFSKPVTGYGVDQMRQSLSYGALNLSGYTDLPLDAMYLTKIKKMLSGPIQRCQIILPETNFINFKSDKFIYLKTEKLTGLFFVDKITNYKNSVTPVEIDLLPVQ